MVQNYEPVPVDEPYDRLGHEQCLYPIVAFKQASDDLDIERRSDTELSRGFRLVRGY